MSGRLESDAEWKVEMTRMPLDIVTFGGWKRRRRMRHLRVAYRAFSRLLLFSICLYGYKEYS